MHPFRDTLTGKGNKQTEKGKANDSWEQKLKYHTTSQKTYVSWRIIAHMTSFLEQQAYLASSTTPHSILQAFTKAEGSLQPIRMGVNLGSK